MQCSAHAFATGGDVHPWIMLHPEDDNFLLKVDGAEGHVIQFAASLVRADADGLLHGVITMTLGEGEPPNPPLQCASCLLFLLQQQDSCIKFAAQALCTPFFG